MLAREVFLGTNEKFWDNEDALSLHSMEESFIYINQMVMGNLIGYSIRTSSCMLSDKLEGLKSIIEDIKESDICILDVTPQDKTSNTLTEHVRALLISCIKLNKKVILVHNREYSCEEIINSIDPENLLGVFAHDGNSLPEEVIACVNAHFQDDERYQRVNDIVLTNEDEISIKENIVKWMQEKEVGFSDFWHFTLDSDKFYIRYEGYNTPPLCTLIFDISSLNRENKIKAHKDLLSFIPKLDNIFIYDSFYPEERKCLSK